MKNQPESQEKLENLITALTKSENVLIIFNQYGRDAETAPQFELEIRYPYFSYYPTRDRLTIGSGTTRTETVLTPQMIKELSIDSDNDIKLTLQLTPITETLGDFLKD